MRSFSAEPNYIHPLYALDGQILTEDFSSDHRHHRGIFLVWHQLYIGSKRIGDGWEIKGFDWDIKSMGMVAGQAGAKTIQTEVLLEITQMERRRLW